MGRLFLILVIAASLAWSVFVGLHFINLSEHQLTPNKAFNATDKSVLLVLRNRELSDLPLLGEFKQNKFLPYLDVLPFQEHNISRVYISANNGKILLEKNNNWRSAQVDLFLASIKENKIKHFVGGRFLLLTNSDWSENESKNTTFQNYDVKASAVLWDFTQDNKWKRTDIYALNSGYFEYQSIESDLTLGKPVNDVEWFGNVIPSSLKNYTFYEKFYWQTKDSIFTKSPLNEWCNKGFVMINYKGEEVLVTDYQAMQVPGLVLLEKALEDSVQIFDELQSFTGFQLTKDFPKDVNERIFLIEIEDKCLITTNKSTAEALLMEYNLGQTLALDEGVRTSLFKGLPAQSHFRNVSNNAKLAVKYGNGTKFQVSTLPPQSDARKMTNNWTHTTGFSTINFLQPIQDHLRAEQSVLAVGDNGDYVLLNAEIGEVIWVGSVNENIKFQPQVVDIYDNDKHQFLLVSAHKIGLLDLNGDMVNGFPFESDYEITTDVSVFQWNNQTRFIFGNEKGELVMLNNQGQELNVIQMSSKALRDNVYAINVGGNLRAWAIDSDNNLVLGYLEKPVKPESLGKSMANVFHKNGSNVLALLDSNDKAYLEIQGEQKYLSDGKVFGFVNDFAVVIKNNEVLFFNLQGELSKRIMLSFNEIDNVQFLNVNDDSHILLHDVLENNIYLYDQNNELLKGFPKEGRRILTGINGKIDGHVLIFSTINKAVVCYKYLGRATS